MQISARAPCRIDFAGGTLDIWPLYLFHPGAVTVNVAINLYATCTLRTRRDHHIHLHSRDLAARESFSSLAALRSAPSHHLPLPATVIRFFAPRPGFSLETNSQAPAGAGISGSSALVIAVSGALNRLTRSGYPPEKLREIAQNLEAQVIRVPAGAQDFYPALYGGASAIEMGPAGIVRRAIPVRLDDFNQRIVLAYTGAPRNSGINNWEVMKAHIDGDRRVHRNFDRITAIAQAMHAALAAADWPEVGRLLREEWAHRRHNVPTITTPLIDRLVAVTRRAGATGAKVCGAGGGGCVFFLAERGARERVAAAIEREGATVLPVRIAPKGLEVTVP
jgi:D-glycero-alpha-D-manno-heptose-7-phosphate kinase